MKKIFTLGILFLLPFMYMTTASAQSLTPPEFSSDDNSNEIWYYIRFGRQANNNLVWSTDYPSNENSWGVKQLTKKTEDKETQQWKLVGELGSFYIINRATGFKIAYADVVDAEKGIRGGNYIVAADGRAGANFKLAGSKDNLVATYWNWSGALDWVMINPAINDHAFLNDRAQSTDFPWRDVCSYGYADDGFRIQFVYAERQTIVVPVDSFAVESLLNHTGKSIFSGIDNFNMTDGITASIEGDDAQYFGFAEGVNTLPESKGSLTITFTPQEVRMYHATLVLRGGTAEAVSVRLYGTGFTGEKMPEISSEDDDPSNEHWYYIQSYRQAAANTVWSLSDTTLMIVQDTLKPAAIRDNQQWKICGTWEEGYFLVNKAGKVEMTYNVTASDDGTKPANRYLRVANGLGDYFNFARFGTTEDWQFYNASTTASSKYVNESGGKFLTNYSKNDAGNRLIFIPADKPLIITSKASLDLEIPVNEQLTQPLLVSGLNLAADITASISGDDASAFGFGESGSILPATGGTLNITFSPLAVKAHTATLTLTSGTVTLTVALFGNSDLGIPAISTSANEVWYYVSFTRKPDLAWTALPSAESRYDTKVMQTTKTTGNTDQQWKFTGDWTNGYRIINRNGGVVFVDTAAVEKFALLIEEEAFGDLFLFKRQNSTANWQLQIVDKYIGEPTYSYLNDDKGSSGDGSISLYLVNDGGNTLIFTPASGENSIDRPSSDSNDVVVSVKYYTLLGKEVIRPAATGIYIVRNTYASGKVKAIKQLVIIK